VLIELFPKMLRLRRYKRK